MESLTTSAMIGGIVAFLGGKLRKDKSIDGFLSEFTEATFNWIRPFFLEEDGTEKEIVKNLKDKPESAARRKAVESALEVGLEDMPEAEQYIKEIFEAIQAKGGSDIIFTKLKAKDGIDIKAEQENSKAEFDNLDTNDGKINIDIKQK